jgi:hypothetical protein
MYYSTWLWDQLDIPSYTGKFAKLCWDDVNNGCALPTFSAKAWLNHFEEKHSENKDQLSIMLIKVYKEYMLSLGKK